MNSKTAANLTPEEIARFRETIRQRENSNVEKTRQKFIKARQVAKRAAAFLRETFQVERVVLFGSAAVPDLFHDRSDIDLAVWGIDEKQYFRAVGMLQAIDPEFSIDLILFKEASARFQATILNEGIDL